MSDTELEILEYFFLISSKWKMDVYGQFTVVALHPQHTIIVMSGRSVNLSTLFLGRLRPPR